MENKKKRERIWVVMNNGNREHRNGSNQTFRRNNQDFHSSSGRRDYKRYEDYGPTDFYRDLDDERIDVEDVPPSYQSVPDYEHSWRWRGSGSHPYRFDERQNYSRNPSTMWSPTSDEQNFREESYEFEREGRFKGVGPKGYRRSDERIKEDVCDFLTQAPNLNCSDIEVSVNDGIVTLKGTVDERRMKRMAEETIEYIPGVNDVRNEIRVQASGNNKAQDHQVRQWQRPQRRLSSGEKSKRQ